MSWPGTDFEVQIQSELDELRQVRDTHARMLASIRTLLDNYNSDEFLGADRALGEISQLVGRKP